MSGIFDIARAALDFAHAAADVQRCQKALHSGYSAWRQSVSYFEHVERDSLAWNLMMAATAEEYRQLQNAKGRERRAKTKLLRLAGEGK